MPRVTPQEARGRILDAANNYRQSKDPNTKPLTRRHLNKAVQVCRVFDLVTPFTLKRAGFNPRKKR